MENLQIEKVFTEQDVEFNKKIVAHAKSLQGKRRIPDSHGGKMNMNGHHVSNLFGQRDYDFTSQILGDFRKKWRISE